MPAAVPTVTIDSVDNTQKLIHVYGTVALAAGDYAAGGIVISFQTDQIKASDAPIDVKFESQPLVASKTTSTFLYGWLKGTTLALGQLQIFTGAAAQSALAELADGALPAAVVADRIRFHAVFVRL